MFLKATAKAVAFVPFYFWTDGLGLRRFHYALNEAAKYDKVKPKDKWDLVASLYAGHNCKVNSKR